ncbi:hypothetical protein [Bordetella sp. FB-8]|uniref:hypothetical protein n=1 Tax=Bordetella sp. FB-8 TaxID=1159870 RepID=UPI0003672C48|nr:hypothetical protein [Bordetella sp. FB-8]
MHTRRLALATTLITLMAALSGCSSTRHPAASTASAAGAPFAVDSSCRRGSSCMYNGHYDPGEREYAEKEARRLNEAEYQRLVHSSW